MQDILVQIIFGWPAVITSLLVSVAGLWFKKPILLVVGGILIILFTIYISGYWRPAGILPLFQLGAAYALWKKKTTLAWVLLSPLVIMSVSLAYVVLTQPR
jgi:hypothetical protein